MKIYLGQLLDEWLDDDGNNMEKWEDNKLSASDRRILLANWYYQAVKKALEGDAKLKYFLHAGALLTADGSDDELIFSLKAPLLDTTFKFKFLNAWLVKMYVTFHTKYIDLITVNYCTRVLVHCALRWLAA